jgi:hypothetical protein
VTIENRIWTVAALRGIEEAETGRRVEILKDAPGSTVAIAPVAPTGFVHDSGGDVDAPLWLVGNVEFATSPEDESEPAIVSAFTIVDSKPGWHRFGPDGEALISIRRAMRWLTPDRILPFADRDPGRPGLIPLPVERLADFPLDRRRMVMAGEALIRRTYGELIQRLRLSLDLDPAERQPFSRASTVVGSGFVRAAAAAVAGPGLSEHEREELMAIFRELDLPAAGDPWRPPAPRRDRLDSEMFRLVVRELSRPTLVSPRQWPGLGKELIAMWSLPLSGSTWWDSISTNRESEQVLPASTRLRITESGRTWARAIALDGPLAGTERTLTPWTAWTLVAPDEPILADSDRKATLFNRLVETWHLAESEKHDVGILAPHESPVRAIVSESLGLAHTALHDLNEAQSSLDGAVVLEGDYGGQIYLTCPARLVGTDEAGLLQLLSELDELEWRGAHAASIYYEVLPVASGVPGGMEGGELVDGVWLHPRLEWRGIRSEVEKAIRGEPYTLLPTSVDFRVCPACGGRLGFVGSRAVVRADDGQTAREIRFRCSDCKKESTAWVDQPGDALKAESDGLGAPKTNP